MWRFCSAIHGSANFWKSLPDGVRFKEFDKALGTSFPKISEAKDGRREAHTDVLVAVFGKLVPRADSTQIKRTPYSASERRRSTATAIFSIMGLICPCFIFMEEIGRASCRERV